MFRMQTVVKDVVNSISSLWFPRKCVLVILTGYRWCYCCCFQYLVVVIVLCELSFWNLAIRQEVASTFLINVVFAQLAESKRGLPRLQSLRCQHINLVDPASSHMLVSKIKPCMSQYKLLHGETANGSLKQLSFIWWLIVTWITMVILELIHAPKPDSVEGLCLLGTEPT